MPNDNFFLNQQHLEVFKKTVLVSLATIAVCILLITPETVFKENSGVWDPMLWDLTLSHCDSEVQ
jgi:hypothetical protein